MREKATVGGGGIPSVVHRDVRWMDIEGNGGRRPIEMVTEPFPCTGDVAVGRLGYAPTHYSG